MRQWLYWAWLFGKVIDGRAVPKLSVLSSLRWLNGRYGAVGRCCMQEWMIIFIITVSIFSTVSRFLTVSRFFTDEILGSIPIRNGISMDFKIPFPILFPIPFPTLHTATVLCDLHPYQSKPCNFYQHAFCAAPIITEFEWNNREICPVACDSYTYHQTAIQVRIKYRT